MTVDKESIIIWHHGSIHFKNFFITLWLLWLLWIIHNITEYFFPSITLITWIIIGIALVIYIRFLLEFLNLYLDAIVISKSGISIFLWNKILNYSVQHHHRDHIESISHLQTSLNDKIRNKWIIRLNLNHGDETLFHGIWNPKEISDILRKKKSQFESKIPFQSDPQETYNTNEKFDILVETLWEVIKDYMEKDIRKNKNPDRTSGW